MALAMRPSTERCVGCTRLAHSSRTSFPLTRGPTASTTDSMIAAAAPSTNQRRRGAPSPGPLINCSMGGAQQMPDSSQANDVASYASAVRAALAPLPDAERESLLEDLENHLAEVASESDLSLQERLGPPEDYAAELRSAYGGGNETSSGRHRPARERAAALLKSVSSNLTYPDLPALLPELRP